MPDAASRTTRTTAAGAMGRPAVCAALIAVVVLAAYANALPASFQFDDYNIIVDNPAVHGIGAWWDSMPGIRPLLKLSYALNWSAAASPLGFHLFNIACHLANAVAVWLLARSCLPRLLPGVEAVGVAALAAALVFALHPAQTEAVTYVAGRSMSLMALFYLAAVLAYAHGSHGARLASPLLFALALATRETAWTLPLALVLLHLLTGLGPVARVASARERKSRWRDACAGTALHWLVLGAAALAAFATPGYRRLLGASLDARTLGHNLLTQVDGLWYLVTHPLLTVRTNIDPDLAVRTALAPDLAFKAALLAGTLAAAVSQVRRRPWLAFGVLWFFLHLLPTNSVLPRLDVANDRHLYLALIGPACMLAALLWKVTGRRAASVSAAALVAVLSAATIVRNADYRSEVALWQATAVRSAHKARVWNNLGYAHAMAGDREAAAAAYERALALDPAHVKALYNLDALHRGAD